MNWNYESITEKSSGYEDVIDTLNEYTPEKYKSANEEEKEQMVQEVFNIYRSKNIYPITYYNKQGIINEINKCIEKEVVWESDVLDFKYLQGNNLSRFLFPNLEHVDCGTAKNNSMYHRFYDDYKLKKSIALCLRYEKPRPIGILRCMRLIGGSTATNFYAMKAKALYERYCPKNGVIYDFACGFGGRMLGALSSKNNYKYFGVEPNTETFENLNKLGVYIEEVTGKNNTYKIFCKGSEDFVTRQPDVADFAFSSPPYFSLEKYCEEETQCYNKFPNLEDWFDGYVKPTIRNIYYMLKPNSFYAVNIADFNLGSKRIEYVDRWIELSKEIGFEYIKQIHMKVQTRRGVGHKDNGKDIPKQEGIFVFKKM
jgi:SAM-dependent methyltransferase